MPCEVLYMNEDNPAHADPVKDKRGVYKKGDIVVLRNPGTYWGPDDGLPKFKRLLISDKNKAEMLRLIQPEMVFNAEKRIDEEVTCRQYCIHDGDLPPVIAAKLDREGADIIDWADLAPACEDKVTQTREA